MFSIMVSMLLWFVCRTELSGIVLPKRFRTEETPPTFLRLATTFSTLFRTGALLNPLVVWQLIYVARQLRK